MDVDSSKFTYGLVQNKVSDPKRLAVCLPGRGDYSYDLPSSVLINVSRPWKVIAIYPDLAGHYPPPSSARDQRAAMMALPASTRALVEKIDSVRCFYGLSWEAVACLGHSAGGVMAYQVAMSAPISALVVFSGAILDPRFIQAPANPSMQALVFHHHHDRTFYWGERYIPTKKALMQARWKAKFVETKGGHDVFDEEVVKACGLIDAVVP